MSHCHLLEVDLNFEMCSYLVDSKTLDLRLLRLDQAWSSCYSSYSNFSTLVSSCCDWLRYDIVNHPLWQCKYHYHLFGSDWNFEMYSYLYLVDSKTLGLRLLRPDRAWSSCCSSYSNFSTLVSSCCGWLRYDIANHPLWPYMSHYHLFGSDWNFEMYSYSYLADSKTLGLRLLELDLQRSDRYLSYSNSSTLVSLCCDF